MKSKKELNDVFKALSDNEIEEIKDIIVEIIEYKIQDEEVISHLFDRVLSIVFIEDDKKREIFHKLSSYTREFNKELADDYDEILEEDLNEKFDDEDY
jgi:predicted transcriptional regulator